MFIRSVEEGKQRWAYSYSKPPGPLIHIIHALLSTAFKLIAELTRYTHAVLEYKIHNMSLTSDSRQDLQLDSRSIPSVHVEPRHSYQFRLHANYHILWVEFIHFAKYV